MTGQRAEPDRHAMPGASRGSRGGVPAALLSATAWLLAALVPAAQAQLTPGTSTRSTEFDYDPVHGQVALERIDPGLPTCVEKAYAYDNRGNKTRVTVRPCAHIAPDQPTWFAPRITVNEFAAREQDEPGAAPGTTTHGAGAYLIRTRSGAADAAGTGRDTSQPYTQDEAAYDMRFGAAVRQTSVTPNNLSCIRIAPAPYGRCGGKPHRP